MRQYSFFKRGAKSFLFLLLAIFQILVFNKTFAALPTNVQLKTFYDTTAIRFTEPVWFEQYPGETGAYIVGELGGNLFLLEPITGGFKSTAFGHIPATKVSGNDGLLGIAFHPNFITNRKYYVYYIPVLGQGLLEERTAKASFKADSGITRTILQSTFGNTVHNGGDIHFGSDGYLYLGFGDAGNPNVYNANSQDLHLLYGKMIRIDINNKATGLQYVIPSSNPFYNSTDVQVRKEIWAYGLRNPWRWTFDPLTGRMFLADVGDWIQEEVDTITPGGNYGWSKREGNTCFNSAAETSPLATCDTTGLIGPLTAIAHASPTALASACIIGGVVFRGNSASGSYGAYIFGDYTTRKLYAMLPVSKGVVQTATIGTTSTGMASFGTDSKGNIYMVGHDNGIIYRLDHPDLVGSTAISHHTIQKAKVLIRQGEKWLVDAQTFPGISQLRVLDLSGKVCVTLNRTQLSQGVTINLSPGIYFAEGQGNLYKTTFSLLLK